MHLANIGDNSFPCTFGHQPLLLMICENERFHRQKTDLPVETDIDRRLHCNWIGCLDAIHLGLGWMLGLLLWCAGHVWVAPYIPLMPWTNNPWTSYFELVMEWNSDRFWIMVSMFYTGTLLRLSRSSGFVSKGLSHLKPDMITQGTQDTYLYRFGPLIAE